MEKKNKSAGLWQSAKMGIATIFTLLLVGILSINFIAFDLYKSTGINTIIPYDAKLTATPFSSIIFILIGLLMLGISCFVFLQFHSYQTGKLYASYVLLLGLSISLAPCIFAGDSFIPLLRNVMNLGSSILLFQIVGHLTLLKWKRLYKILWSVIILLAAAGLILAVFALFPFNWDLIYDIAGAAENGCVFLVSLFCLLTMAVNYPGANEYSRRQSKTLFMGIGAGALLYFVVSLLPDIIVVQNVPSEEAVMIEVTMDVQSTVSNSIPLLLLAGASAAIIFLLLRREFTVDDRRLRLWHFICFPMYISCIGVLLFFADTPIPVIVVVLIFMILPVLYWFWRLFSSPEKQEEQSYEKRLLSEVEKEKQELSVYLHDEVLQSLIAVYRNIRADEGVQSREMEAALSGLISGVRRVSHNLYPTAVEDLGLEQSLMICVSELKNDYPKMSFSYSYHFRDGILPKELALTIYRCAKELMTNAAKHSGGTEVSLLLEEDGTGYFLSVDDNGSGLSETDAKKDKDRAHMGLYTVKKQIAALGGSMEFIGKHGTHFKLFFPKET